MSEKLRDEDDFTHYFNATQRLSQEVARLREALEYYALPGMGDNGTKARIALAGSEVISEGGGQ